jgi:hypothetical protein
MLMGPTIGMRLHAFHGDAEVVIGLSPLRVIQSDAPAWVEAEVLAWARQHEDQLRSSWRLEPARGLPHSERSRGSTTVR